MQDIWRLVVAPNPVLDDVLRQQLLIHSAQASRLSSLLGLPMSAVVVGALLTGGAPAGQTLIWAGLSLVTMLIYVLGVGHLVSNPRSERPYRTRLRRFGGFQVLAGLTWGLLPVMVTPEPGQTAVVAISFAVPTLAAAANIIFSSATPLPWLCFHLSAMLAASVGLLAHGEGEVAMLNGLTFFAALPLARYMFQQVARARLVARHNELLAADLRTEREAVERINLELSEANTELRHQATRDPLTGLPNRSLFFDHLARSIRHGRRNSTPVAVIYFDLDRFKAVNDSLGHGAGDDLLRQVADRVTAVLRSPDILARLGGDEFVVLTHDFEGNQAQDAPAAVAERVRQVLAVPFDLAGTSVIISGSLGLAVDEAGLSSEDLLERADLALYRAKELGRNQVSVFEEELDWTQPGVEN